MPPVPASRKFEIVTTALALAEERKGVAIADAAAAAGVSEDQLRGLLDAVLYLEYRDGNGVMVDHTREFLLDEHGVLKVEYGQSNWLRDLAATTPSDAGLLRLYIAASVYQATTETPSAALDRALATLRSAIAVDMVVPISRPTAAAAAQEARDECRSLRFRYVRWKDEQATDREVLPYEVFSDWGHWYVSGPQADDPNQTVKHWRIDRMQDVTIGDRGFEPPTELPPREWFDLGDRTHRLRVRVPEHRIAALPAPHTICARDEPTADGKVCVELEVAGERQLAHLLVSLGPDGEVVEPADYELRRQREARRLLDHVTNG